MALEDEEAQLLPGLAELVQCTDSLAQQSAEQEAAGELGYLDIVSPKPMEASDIRMLSWKIDAEALSMATKVGAVYIRSLLVSSDPLSIVMLAFKFQTLSSLILPIVCYKQGCPVS